MVVSNPKHAADWLVFITGLFPFFIFNYCTTCTIISTIIIIISSSSPLSNPAGACPSTPPFHVTWISPGVCFEGIFFFFFAPEEFLGAERRKMWKFLQSVRKQPVNRQRERKRKRAGRGGRQCGGFSETTHVGSLVSAPRLANQQRAKNSLLISTDQSESALLPPLNCRYKYRSFGCQRQKATLLSTEPDFYPNQKHFCSDLDYSTVLFGLCFFSFWSLTEQRAPWI